MANPLRWPDDFPTVVMLATERALWPSALVAMSSINKATKPARKGAHHPPNGEAEQQRERAGNPAQTKSVDEIARRKAKGRAQEGGPEVDSSVGHTINPQIL